MKLVQFYPLTTILITLQNSYVSCSGYLSPEELEYLSKRLYPAECSYLTTELSKSLQSSCKSLRQSSDDILSDRPELHCLFKLEEWNEIALSDESAHKRMDKILHEIGRFDLAAYLSKEKKKTRTIIPVNK